VRSPDLIVCVFPCLVSGTVVRRERSDRKPCTNQTALVVQYCFNPETISDIAHGVEVPRLDCVCPYAWCPETCMASVQTESPVRAELVVSVLF